MLNAYQAEQLDGHRLVRQHLRRMPAALRRQLAQQVAPYLDFREQVDRFIAQHCDRLCTLSCFQSKVSACCSKDGIITFWADLVVNAIHSDSVQSERLIKALQRPLDNHKCIYLGADGCHWQVRPMVCAMFLCDKVLDGVFNANKALEEQWSDLKALAKGFRWPDRPVLFDDLEKVFIARGCRSDLMYLHNSPGLLRVKQKAGLI